jgi:sRNA-binding carbon storage regulator CsrA
MGKFREYITSEGVLVLAGKDSSSNEDLIKQAGESEFVFHTQKPGSPFVNIKYENPSEKDIKEARLLCARYSQDWRDNHQDVLVSEFYGKDIFKEKNMKIGTFGVKGRKEIKIKKSEINAFIKKEENKKDFQKEFSKKLEELKKLNLPVKHFAIFGSGYFGLSGIREVKDLDIIVSESLWEELVQKYPVKNERLIQIGNIEIYKNWEPWFQNTSNLIKDCDNFKGFKFVKLKYVLEWKKKFNREKDKKDIKMIEYLINYK